MKEILSSKQDSYILSEDFESLLEASNELWHVAQ